MVLLEVLLVGFLATFLAERLAVFLATFLAERLADVWYPFSNQSLICSLSKILHRPSYRGLVVISPCQR